MGKMTKQEFATRLLIWLLPWPLSKPLPRSLLIYYFGPRGMPTFFDLFLHYFEPGFDPPPYFEWPKYGIPRSWLDPDFKPDPDFPLPSGSKYWINLPHSYTYDPFNPPEIRNIPSLPAGPTNLFDPLSVWPGYGHWAGGARGRSNYYVWFYDLFSGLDLTVWTEWNEGTGNNSIVDRWLKMESLANGDYTCMYTADDDSIPDYWTLSFDLNVTVNSGKFLVWIMCGAKNPWIRFTPPTTLEVRGTSGWVDLAVDPFFDTTDLWQFQFNGTTIDVYRNGVLVASDLSVYEYAFHKGQINLSSDDISTVYIDNFYITQP